MRRSNVRGVVALSLEDDNVPEVTVVDETNNTNVKVEEPANSTEETRVEEVPTPVEGSESVIVDTKVRKEPNESISVENDSDIINELLELEEVEGVNADREKVIEEAGEVIEALEAIANVLEYTIKNKSGIDKNTATILHISTEHLYSRVGYKPSKKVALEAFGGISTRMSATEAIYDDIKASAKKIWEAIIATITRAIEWSKEFFSKIFDSWEKIEKRVTEIESKSKNIKGTGKITNTHVINAILIDGKVPPPKLGFERFITFVNEICLNTTENNIATSSVISELPSVTIRLPPVIAWFKDVELVTNTKGFPDAPNNLDVFRSKELYGGNALIITAAKDGLGGVDAANACGSVSFKMGKYNPLATDPKVKEIPALDTFDIEELLRLVKYVSSLGLNVKSVLKVIEVDKKKLIARAKEFSNNDDTDINTRKVIIGLSKILDQPLVAGISYTLRTCKALLDYCELSIKAETTK